MNKEKTTNERQYRLWKAFGDLSPEIIESRKNTSPTLTPPDTVSDQADKKVNFGRSASSSRKEET